MFFDLLDDVVSAAVVTAAVVVDTAAEVTSFATLCLLDKREVLRLAGTGLAVYEIVSITGLATDVVEAVITEGER